MLIDIEVFLILNNMKRLITRFKNGGKKLPVQRKEYVEKNDATRVAPIVIDRQNERGNGGAANNKDQIREDIIYGTDNIIPSRDRITVIPGLFPALNDTIYTLESLTNRYGTRVQYTPVYHTLNDLDVYYPQNPIRPRGTYIENSHIFGYQDAEFKKNLEDNLTDKGKFDIKKYQNSKQNRDSLRTRYPSNKRFQRIENGDNRESNYENFRMLSRTPYEFVSLKEFK